MERLEEFLRDSEEAYKVLKEFDNDLKENSIRLEELSAYGEFQQIQYIARVKEIANRKIELCTRRIQRLEEEFLAISKEIQQEIKEEKENQSYIKFVSNLKKRDLRSINELKRDLRKLEARREKLNSHIKSIKNNNCRIRFKQLKEIKSAKNGRWTTKHQGFRGVEKWNK